MDKGIEEAIGQSEPTQTPSDSVGRLFARFLRFGCLAWGGPVAQIDMIRHEIVEEKRWVTRDQFKRILAIYQVLPGPEAHELCVHFGMLAHGRFGGILAGVGFMLPGSVLMFLLSWAYLSFKLEDTFFQAVFRGIQPAVIALIFTMMAQLASRHVKHSAVLDCGSILKKYGVQDAELTLLGEIVRAADSRPTNPHPAGEGLRWIAHGFSALGLTDQQILDKEFIVYDALYAECKRQVAGTPKP